MMLALCFILIFPFGNALASRSHCKVAVEEWASEQLRDQLESGNKPLKELLFFLHVPRTAGRTFYHCFLRHLYPKEEMCPRSYDKLRFTLSRPRCKVLTTHDDYSILTRLSKEMTSIVTNLRHPLDRVFSTYEFSIEVAARSLGSGRNQSMTRKLFDASGQSVLRATPVSTLDIWPWKHLVPFMRDDLFLRRAARIANLSVVPTEMRNFYNVSSIAMPLHDFIQHREAFELVHNGATFQVVGLTSDSFLEDAKKLRLCIQKYSELGIHALRVAKKRLSEMLYVGLTERQEESAMAFASIVGLQASSQFANLSLKMFSKNHENHQLNEGRGHWISLPSKSSVVDVLKQQKELLDNYHSCVKALRQSYALRRKVSLKNITPIKYSPELRKNVPNLLVKEILHLNSLDVKLYKHAVNIFEKQKLFLMDPSNLPGDYHL